MVQINYPTHEELEADRAAILAAYPNLLQHAADGELVGPEWVAYAEYGDICWLLGD